MITQWCYNKWIRLHKLDTTTVTRLFERYNYLPDIDFWIIISDYMDRFKNARKIKYVPNKNKY